MFRWLFLLLLVAVGLWFFWPVTARPIKPPSVRLAPEGVFFLTEYVSISDGDGVRGFPPGTKVTRLEDLGESLQVRNSIGTTLKVLKQKLTNDLDVAETASRRDDKAQKLAAQARAQAGRSVQILGATYGYGTNIVDVTARLQEEIQNGNTTIRAGNHLAGRDPFSGKVKTLEVTYSIGGGSPITVRLREGESLPLLASETSLATQQRGELRSQQQAMTRPTTLRPKSTNPLHQQARKHNPDGPKDPQSDVY